MKPLTDRDVETLRALAAANRSHEELGFRKGWARPMDCGGWNGSHHSNTLTKLVKRGYAVVQAPRAIQFWRSIYSGGKSYKITDKGTALLRGLKKQPDDK